MERLTTSLLVLMMVCGVIAFAILLALFLALLASDLLALIAA